MPTLHIPDMMKFYVEGQTELFLDGGTVAEILNELVTRYPAIKSHIVDGHGKPRRFVNLFVNKTNIKELNGLDTSLQESDNIILLPSISGG